MPPKEFKTQVLLLHSDQGTLDKLGSEFDLRYTVHLATSGSQALKALAEVPIDIFVSSQDLPGMSGLEALREAKKRSPQTHGILLTNATADEGAAFVGHDEVFQIVRGDVTGEALVELVDNASQQMHLPLLSKPANDTTAHETTAHADGGAENIVMETADDGSSIISQSSVRLRALNVKSIATAAPVDVLILTTDAEFLETIRSSSRSLHKFHSVATLPEADDIIRNHKIGVAVVDAAIVRDKVEQLTQYLRREAPRLVSVVAGRRDDGEMLMDLINRGKLYRFLLKPVSAGRARLAVEASVKYHLEAPDAAFANRDHATKPPRAATESTSQVADVPQKIASEPVPDAPADNEVVGEPGEEPHGPEAPDNSAVTDSLSKTGAFRMAKLAVAESRAARPTQRFGKIPVIGTVAAVLAMVAIGVFFLAGPSEENLEPQTANVPVTAAPAATEADVVVAPPAVEQLINVAETALLDSRLQDTDDALRRVTALDPANARLPFLTAQLAQAQLRLRLNEARAAIREGRFEDASDALSAAQSLTAVSGSTEFETLTAELESARSDQQTDAVLALANASLESGALLSPPNGNARYYYELVLSNDPENAAAQQGLSTIANRVVLQARAEIDRGNFKVAQELLYDARALDSQNSELISTADALQAARESAKAARAARESAKAALAAEESAKAALVATAAATAAMQTSDTERPADNAAPVADENPTPDVVPASVSSLVRTNYVAPKYPRNALRRNLTGWVDIEFTVSTEGTVKDVGVRASEPGDLFVNSATRAVEQWEFEPVFSDGIVVEKRAAVRMMFSLD